MQAYPDQRRRRLSPEPLRSPPETEADRVIQQLFPVPPPITGPLPRRRFRKVVQHADGTRTAVEFVVEIDPATQEQRVDTMVYTTKVECPLCGRLASKLYECQDCWKRVCGACLTTRKVFLGEKPVCRNCWR